MKLFELKTFRYISIIIFLFIISVIVGSTVSIKNSGSTLVYDSYLNQGIKNTLIIGVSVVIITALISIFLAVINVYFDYPFKKTIHILSFLPMTIPCYILAYQYNTLISHGGELEFINFKVTSLFGAILIYSASFFPYGYMLVRSSLLKIPFNIIETAYTIDSNFLKVVYKVILPLVSKSIMAGSILILGEVYSDIGVVEYANIKTISTVVKDTFVSNNNYGLALQLGLKFGIVMVFLLMLESLIFPKISYSNSKLREIKLLKSSVLFKSIYYTTVILLLSFSFFIPVFYMVKWFINSASIYDFDIYFSALFNTIKIIFVTTVAIVVIGLVISHINKYNRKLRTLYALFNIWYILPSILISLMLSMYFLNINSIFNTKIISSITIIVLFIAYVIKYLPIALNMISKSYMHINNRVIESAITMEENRFKTFYNTDFKLLRTALIASIAVITTDLVKELTLTYTLRPFNFQTLSTMTAMYAKDEMIHESSLYSLTIIAVCIICVLFLTRKEIKK